MTTGVVSNLGVFHGAGDRTLETIVPFVVGAGYAVTADDLNGDGKQDLLRSGPTFPFFEGNGWSIETADFNGDSRVDLVVMGDDFAGLYYGNGAGSFRPSVDYPVGGAAWSIIPADLNGDEATDLVVVKRSPDGGVTVLMQTACR